MPQVGTSHGDPIRQVYDCGSFDFGGGSASSLYLAGPKGARGKVREIIFATTEIFATDSSDGKVEVGTVSDADAYASATITDETATNTVFRGADGYGDDPDAIIADIPADTHVKITLTNGTDAGTVSGIASVLVVIDWF